MSDHHTPRVMQRATQKCDTCPFRDASESYKRSSAHIQPEDWPCHTEDLDGDLGIQCRGHWQAVHKSGSSIGPQADEHDLSHTGD
jgi:hypothetical protein